MGDKIINRISLTVYEISHLHPSALAACLPSSGSRRQGENGQQTWAPLIVLRFGALDIERVTGLQRWTGGTGAGAMMVGCGYRLALLGRFSAIEMPLHCVFNLCAITLTVRRWFVNKFRVPLKARSEDVLTHVNIMDKWICFWHPLVHTHTSHHTGHRHHIRGHRETLALIRIILLMALPWHKGVTSYTNANVSSSRSSVIWARNIERITKVSSRNILQKLSCIYPHTHPHGRAESERQK